MVKEGLKISDILWSKRKVTTIIAIILATALAIIGGFYYYTMHNTFVYSLVLANDRIIASDGRGQYRDGIDGVSYGTVDDVFYTRDEEGYMASFSLNGSSRSVYVNFTHALWKDANLRDVPSRLSSKNYHMILVFLVIGYDKKPVDFYNMGIGEYLQYKSPQIQVQFRLNDFDTGQFTGIYVWQEPTIRELGVTHDLTASTIYQYYNVWLPTNNTEPPQSLRDDSHMTLTRVSDEKWILGVDAWFLTYYRTIWGNMLKYYIKLSLYLTINRYRAM